MALFRRVLGENKINELASKIHFYNPTLFRLLRRLHYRFATATCA
jgi:DNA-binding MurR/RpiR family transcriptional regulator